MLGGKTLKKKMYEKQEKFSDCERDD